MASPPDSCPYAVLQVAPTASLQELRQAFRRLSKQVHPDTTSLPPQEAEPAFRRLQQAYALLSDPGRRQAYDARRLAAAAAAVSSVVPGPGVAGPPASGAPAARPRWAAVASQRPEPVRRALSGGEWFALLLLGLALLLSLVLGVGLAWARGAELVRLPSWWSELQVRRVPLPAGPSPVAPSSELSSELSADLSADSAVALPADASAAFPSEAPVFPADRSAALPAGLASGLLAPDRPASQGPLGQPAAEASRVAASRVAASRVAARIPAVLPSADG